MRKSLRVSKMKNSSKRITAKKSKSKKKGNGSIDGFTNEERLQMNQNVIDYYFNLFSKNKWGKKMKVKKGYVLYPLDDFRTNIKIEHLLQKYLNKDGSLKIGFAKKVEQCKNKTYWLCK